jgi:hypothetical protein
MKRAALPLVAIAVLFTAMGALLPHLSDASEGRGLNFILSVACSVLLFVWCKADAAARGIDPPSPSALLVGLLAPVGVPYYFFRSMAWPAACWATVKAICYAVSIFVLAAGAAHVSALITR